MKALLCTMIILMLIISIQPAVAQRLASFDAIVYSELSFQWTGPYNYLAYPYGLYRRGCAAYTCNDCQYSGIPNHIIYTGQSGTEHQLTEIADYYVGTAPQQLIVEDWFTTMGQRLTYMYQCAYTTSPCIILASSNDSGDCQDFYVQKDTCATNQLTSLAKDISTFDQDIYLSVDGGLYRARLYNPTSTTFCPYSSCSEQMLNDSNWADIQIIDQTTGYFSIGTCRIGDFIYEGMKTRELSDTSGVVIRDTSLNVVATYYNPETDGARWTSCGFAVAKDTFVVGGTAATRILGFLVHEADGDKVCDIYEFGPNSTISRLNHIDLNLQNSGGVYDVKVLDRYLFIGGNYSDSGSYLVVYDVSDPANASELVSDNYNPNGSGQADAVEAAMYTETDSACIRGTGHPYHLVVVRNLYQDGDYAKLDSTYSIYTNPVAVKQIDEDGMAYAMLWHHHFAPDNASRDTRKLGDLNGDNVLNLQDMMVISSYLGNLSAGNVSPVSRYDINSDGMITFADVRELQYSIYYSHIPPGQTCNICQ